MSELRAGIDILPGNPVAQGRWQSIVSGHELVPMIDRRVLDWEGDDGSWRLWNYDPASAGDILPGNPVAQGQWNSINGGHTLIPMIDGRVLDWVELDGSWRLWNYDASATADVLPGDPVAQGQWDSIRLFHKLIPMHDGRVLDRYTEDGSWRLWNYDPASTGDILPGEPVAQGQWSTIGGGDELIPMDDGRVIDLQADGSWRLWNYDPASTSDIFPGDPVAQGQWSTIDTDHQLILMGDGRVLDWLPDDGSWRLWNYRPYGAG
jgi:hypothetical protein